MCESDFAGHPADAGWADAAVAGAISTRTETMGASRNAGPRLRRTAPARFTRPPGEHIKIETFQRNLGHRSKTVNADFAAALRLIAENRADLAELKSHPLVEEPPKTFSEIISQLARLELLDADGAQEAALGNDGSQS
jgi:hypothetical protein